MGSFIVRVSFLDLENSKFENSDPQDEMPLWSEQDHDQGTERNEAQNLWLSCRQLRCMNMFTGRDVPSTSGLRSHLPGDGQQHGPSARGAAAAALLAPPKADNAGGSDGDARPVQGRHIGAKEGGGRADDHDAPHDVQHRVRGRADAAEDRKAHAIVCGVRTAVREQEQREAQAAITRERAHEGARIQHNR